MRNCGGFMRPIALCVILAISTVNCTANVEQTPVAESQDRVLIESTLAIGAGIVLLFFFGYYYLVVFNTSRQQFEITGLNVDKFGFNWVRDLIAQPAVDDLNAQYQSDLQNEAQSSGWQDDAYRWLIERAPLTGITLALSESASQYLVQEIATVRLTEYVSSPELLELTESVVDPGIELPPFDPESYEGGLYGIMTWMLEQGYGPCICTGLCDAVGSSATRPWGFGYGMTALQAESSLIINMTAVWGVACGSSVEVLSCEVFGGHPCAGDVQP